MHHHHRSSSCAALRSRHPAVAAAKRGPAAWASAARVVALAATFGAAAAAGADGGDSLSFATRFTASALSLAPGAVMQGDNGAAATSSGAGAGASAGDVTASGAPIATSGAGPAPGAGAPRARRAFGEEGMVTFNLFGDFSTDFDKAWMAGGQVGISWFFVDNLSLDVQLEQWGIMQDEGKDAYAIGPAVMLRWHFLPYESWSLYADAGCGFFYATNPVPGDGSRFNFTPRVGIGASVSVFDQARVLTGVRWFHISNANTSSPNPGRDSMELYAGLSLPF